MSTHRRERVASVIRDIVSEAIAHRLHDPRIEPWTTVTRVEVTRDLLNASVFLTVRGSEAAEHRTIMAIEHAAGYLRRLVARELSLRQCPGIRFQIDAAAKGAQETLRILAENRRRHPEVFQPTNEPDPEGTTDSNPQDRPPTREVDPSGGATG